MEQLRAFHGDAKVKKFYLDRVRRHRLADHLVQGVGWEQNGVTKGCAVGCVLEAYDHSRYPKELGLPEWLARLEDNIFEGLPRKDAMKWPEAFLKAIPVGVDVEPVCHRLAILRMNKLIALQEKSVGKHPGAVNDAIVQTIVALQIVKRYHETELGICEVPQERSAARSAAWSAAESAAESAESAAESAESAARSAAWSARSAAESAAESAARSAAWSARSAAWKWEAKTLLKLLAECKPKRRKAA